MTYINTPVTVGTTYTYRVAATNGGGNSAWSNEVSITVVNPPVPPRILTGTSVATSATRQTDTITWSPVPGATTYLIDRSLSPTFATDVITVSVAGGSTTYSVPGLAKVVWYFRMRAVNEAGPSTNSNTMKVAAAP